MLGRTLLQEPECISLSENDMFFHRRRSVQLSMLDRHLTVALDAVALSFSQLGFLDALMSSHISW